MKAQDFNPYFISPTFLFLALLCYAISAVSLVGAFYISPGYIVLSFVFFLFAYAAHRLSKLTGSEAA
ncbi:MAG: hypothetical protein EOM26_09215 [Alphaproteobacteria bacterium]|nr:hypothetical protein [Alphaproteobacteria bacterium]